MKVWRGFAAEHSAATKIIGVFSTVEEAHRAESLFNDLVQAAREVIRDGGDASRTAADMTLRESTSTPVTRAQASQLRRLGEIHAGGREIRVETDQVDVDVLLEILSRFDGQIRIISRDH